MSKPKLTVCIPSFNRHEAAMRCATALLGQVDGSDINIQIIDNGSNHNYLAEFSKTELFEQALAHGTLSIIRNPCNIGMGANFMRCFEVARGDWLWMAADDDELKEDAIESILTAIETHSENCGFIAFGDESELPPSSARYLNSLESFIDFNHQSPDVFNRFIFITNGIYNLAHFRPLLSVGYQHLNTFIPHFMMQVAYMQQGNKSAVLQKKVVDYVVPEIGYSYSMVAGLGVGAPKHTLFKTSDKHYAKYLSIFFPHNDYKVIIDLFYICKRDASPYVCQHLAKNYLHYVADARTLPQMLGLKCFTLLLNYPTLFEHSIALVERVSEKFKSHVHEIRTRYR